MNRRVDCDYCSGQRDPKVPIEYHFHYECTPYMKNRQREFDKKKATKLKLSDSQMQKLQKWVEERFKLAPPRT